MPDDRELTGSELTLKLAEGLGDVSADAWDALVGPRHPFMSHEFLTALETTDCLEPQGWYPQHVLAFDGDRLVGGMPLYLKDNSYGEFVFDWAWADAFERAGGRYYPKLVSAVPFSPVTGIRVPAVSDDVAALVTRYAMGLAEHNGLSSFHQLFPTPAEAGRAERVGCLTRHGIQYQWFNDDYPDFDAFLARLTSRRRKEIRRERRKAADSGLTLATLRGGEITDALWDAYHRFYCSTFYRKWGDPRLTRAFFGRLAETLGDKVVLEMAFDGDTPVAGAFLVAGQDTLFGRHWGAEAAYRYVHFELCYYRPIDMCIREGLARFDAGAQGEHKLQRGFVPVTTYSSHFVTEPGFRRAVEDFLGRERAAVARQVSALTEHVAYREDGLERALKAAAET